MKQHTFFGAPEAVERPSPTTGFSIRAVDAYDIIRKAILASVDDSEMIIETKGGYRAKFDDCEIIDCSYKEVLRNVQIDLAAEKEQALEKPPQPDAQDDFTPYPNEFLMSYGRAYELLLDALRRGDDPLEIKIGHSPKRLRRIADCPVAGRWTVEDVLDDAERNRHREIAFANPEELELSESGNDSFFAP